MQVINARCWYISHNFNIQEKQPYRISLSNGVRYIHLQAYFLFSDTEISVILDSEIQDNSIPLCDGCLKMDLDLQPDSVIEFDNVTEMVLKLQNELDTTNPQKFLCNFTISKDT